MLSPPKRKSHRAAFTKPCIRGTGGSSNLWTRCWRAKIHIPGSGFPFPVKFRAKRDVYHTSSYFASQTPGRGVTENPAHNGSIQGGRRTGRFAAARWARPRYVRLRLGIRDPGSGLHQATGGLRTMTTLLYPKRLPPLVQRTCAPRSGLKLQTQNCWRFGGL